jgi:hypothetical protein
VFDTGWSECRGIQSWHFLFLKKQIILNAENKECYNCLGNVNRAQRCTHSLFSSPLMQPGDEFLQWQQMVHQTRHCRFVWQRRIGNVSLNSFWQVKWERNFRWCSASNNHCTCEEDILALRLLKDNWRTGASRLQHDVTCMGSCSYSYTACNNQKLF